MAVSKTFTTPNGSKATMWARKLYAVVAESRIPGGLRADVILRTDNLKTAVARQRRELNNPSTTYAFVHVFRKADGARLTTRSGAGPGGVWVIP